MGWGWEDHTELEGPVICATGAIQRAATVPSSVSRHLLGLARGPELRETSFLQGLEPYG